LKEYQERVYDEDTDEDKEDMDEDEEDLHNNYTEDFYDDEEDAHDDDKEDVHDDDEKDVHDDDEEDVHDDDKEDVHDDDKEDVHDDDKEDVHDDDKEDVHDDDEEDVHDDDEEEVHDDDEEDVHVDDEEDVHVDDEEDLRNNYTEDFYDDEEDVHDDSEEDLRNNYTEDFYDDEEGLHNDNEVDLHDNDEVDLHDNDEVDLHVDDENLYNDDVWLEFNKIRGISESDVDSADLDESLGNTDSKRLEDATLEGASEYLKNKILPDLREKNLELVESGDPKGKILRDDEAPTVRMLQEFGYGGWVSALYKNNIKYKDVFHKAGLKSNREIGTYGDMTLEGSIEYFTKKILPDLREKNRELLESGDPRGKILRDDEAPTVEMLQEFETYSIKQVLNQIVKLVNWKK